MRQDSTYNWGDDRIRNIAVDRQLLEIRERLIAGGCCIDAKHHATRAVSGLAAVSPNRIGGVDNNLVRRERYGDIGVHRNAAGVV